MSTGIEGGYSGEGPNTSGTAGISGTTNTSDAGTQIQNVDGAQDVTVNRPVAVEVNRRHALRVSSEGARGAVAIGVGGGDQVLANYCRGVYVTGNGNLAVRFVDDAADVTLTGLLAGQWYPFCLAIVRQAATTATGFLLF